MGDLDVKSSVTFLHLSVYMTLLRIMDWKTRI